MRLMHINGRFTQGQATQEIAVHNPATEEVLDTVPRGTAADASAAVAAAVAAAPQWRATVANDRAELLHAAATKLRHHQEHLIRLVRSEGLGHGRIMHSTPQTGRPTTQSGAVTRTGS